MKITDIKALPLRGATQADMADNFGETTLVVVTTDDGLVGVGEGNVAPLAVSAIVDQPEYWIWHRGAKGPLIGRELGDPAELWDELYAGNWWSARNGVGHVALGAIDMALWDLAGKAAGKPVHELLGGPRSAPIMPYITMYRKVEDPSRSIATARAFIDEIKDQGFRAAKIEVSHDQVPDERQIRPLVEAVRDQAGPDFTLLCDACYRWADADEAIAVITQLEDLDLMLFETALLPENLNGYRKLSEATTIPLAGCEIAASYAEFEHLMDFGGVRYVQPCVARVGVTAMDRITRAAAARGREMIPYGWVATTLSMAATLHVVAAHENVPIVEYVPPSFYPYAELRNDVSGPEPVVVDGFFELPPGPGFGVEIDAEAVARYAHAVA
ncbi:MAG TPA: mandelate racemase/muconate lactonizing enzyme family protein [Conexibacter sp.]|jgi:L-rhamnonate dehydratase|nr:mandelate racemase/muconate lactonizing enzyme family protein [Conexibacter sp.]